MASQSGAFSGELRSQPMRFVEAVTYFAEHVLPGKQAAESVEAHGGADLESGVRFGDAAPDDEAAGQRAQLRFGLRHLRRAAVLGDASAQYELGSAYYRGQWVPRNPRQAMRWLRSAAAGGNAEARAFIERVQRADALN